MLQQIHSIIVVLLCGLSLIACQPSQSASAKTMVDANQYASFWIWGNISTAAYLKQAKELYILQGEIRLDQSTQNSILTPQGISILKIPHQKVWLVYRNHHLNWQKLELEKILKRIKQWENTGNQIQGIQIDFDAKTKNLKQYALFLQTLRKQLPKQYQISITGLLDWTNVQDAQVLNLLRQNINELVIQTYQGTSTIPNYQSYLKRISAMHLPYKVGLVQNGQWINPTFIQQDPQFKGYVVFLLRSKPRI